MLSSSKSTSKPDPKSEFVLVSLGMSGSEVSCLDWFRFPLPRVKRDPAQERTFFFLALVLDFLDSSLSTEVSESSSEEERRDESVK